MTTLRLIAIALVILSSGCSRAPSVAIVGSFFPIWMICIAIGVVGAGVERSLLLHFDLESHVEPLWLFYPCTVVLFACVLWEEFYR